MRIYGNKFRSNNAGDDVMLHRDVFVKGEATRSTGNSSKLLCFFDLPNAREMEHCGSRPRLLSSYPSDWNPSPRPVTRVTRLCLHGCRSATIDFCCIFKILIG